MKRTVAGRSVGRGLAKVEVLGIRYFGGLRREGRLPMAADGLGANSPYTMALLNHLTTPGLDVRLALGRVRDEVLKTTGNRQEPFFCVWLVGWRRGSALVAAKRVETAKQVKPFITSQRPSEAAEA